VGLKSLKSLNLTNVYPNNNKNNNNNKKKNNKVKSKPLELRSRVKIGTYIGPLFRSVLLSSDCDCLLLTPYSEKELTENLKPNKVF
jgi:hypothetical protein